MAVYVYACPIRTHPRREVVHSMKEDPTIKCKCGRIMKRVPQPFRFGIEAQSILIDWMCHNEKILRATHDRSKLFSPNLVKRPDKPIPGTQFNTRKAKPNAS